MKTGHKIVKKSNDLIEARYSLTLTEQRLVFFMLRIISDDDEAFKNYEIKITDFADLFGLAKSNAIRDLDEASEKLMGRKLSVRNDRGGWKHFNWFSFIEYAVGTGKVVARFDPAMKTFYAELKNRYTKLDFTILARIKSGYTMRLYELLKMEQFKANGDGVFSKILKLEDLRAFLGLEEKKYYLFADFRKHVLEPSLNEISKQTDLDFENIEFFRSSKAIDEIKITMRVKPETPKLTEPPKPPKPKAEKDELTTRLLDFGFSENQVYELRKTHTNKVLERTLLYTLSMMEQGEIKNPSAYFHKVLKDDGARAWMNEQTKKLGKAEKVATEKAKKEQEATEKAKKEKTDTEAKIQRRERLFKDFYSLPLEQQEALRIIFKGSLSLFGKAEMNIYKNAIASNPNNPEQYKSIIPFFINWYEGYSSNLPIPFEFNN